MTKNYSNEELRMLLCACIARRYTTKESLEFLKSHDCNISERTFFQKKTEIGKQTPLEAKFLLENLLSEHIKRIHELEQIDRELWLICKNTKDDNVKLKTLNSIRENQIQLSEFIKNTQELIHEQMKWFETLPIGNKLDPKDYLNKKRIELETPITETPDYMMPKLFPTLEELNHSRKKRLANFLESEKIDQNNSR